MAKLTATITANGGKISMYQFSKELVDLCSLYTCHYEVNLMSDSGDVREHSSGDIMVSDTRPGAEVEEEIVEAEIVPDPLLLP